MPHTAESQTRSAAPDHAQGGRGPGLAIFFLVGIVFGIVLIKGEVISWFRIQEMFRFQGFHMYGVFATALPVAILSVQVLKRFGVRTATGERVTLAPKSFGTGIRYGAGGTLFGFGWALTGACPGPLFALFGSGLLIFGVVIAAALLGTLTYGILRPKLPH